MPAEPDEASHSAPSSAHKASLRSLLRLWALATLILFTLVGVWSLSTPIGSVGDEPSHIVKAAGTLRGQLLGTDVASNPNPALRQYELPAPFAALTRPCYSKRLSIPAGCAPPLTTSTKTVPALSYVARYPPAYYALVGLPTLFGSSLWTMYFMRLVSALASSVMLGLAFAVAATWSRSRLLTVGIALASTPLVIYYASVVNPNGLEIAASIGAWTCLLVASTMDDAPPNALLACAAGSLAVLEVTRTLSVFWAVLAVLTAVALAPQRWRALWRRVWLRWAALGLGLVAVLSVTWVVLAKSTETAAGKPYPSHLSHLSVLAFDLGRFGGAHGYLQQLIGVTGWLELPTPAVTDAFWIAGAGGLWLLGLALGRRLEIAVFLLVPVFMVVFPIALNVDHDHDLGFIWQARDGMPLFVAVPILASLVVSRRTQLDRSRFPLVVASCTALGLAAASFVVIRRYTVGLAGTINPFAHVARGWSTPIPLLLLFAIELVALVAYVALIASGGQLLGGRGRHRGVATTSRETPAEPALQAEGAH